MGHSATLESPMRSHTLGACLLLLASCGLTTPTSPPAPAPPPAATETASAKPAAKPPVSAARPAAPPKNTVAAPAATKPKTPPLDLASLEKRLKDSSAIGVMTKLTLKNQVDDLLDRFRAYYQSKKGSLAELRQPYETLLMKVLSLLQDSDPALASDIIASREAIWGILSDPKKFATL
jgi:hypothetical protein